MTRSIGLKRVSPGSTLKNGRTITRTASCRYVVRSCQADLLAVTQIVQGAIRIRSQRTQNRLLQRQGAYLKRQDVELERDVVLSQRPEAGGTRVVAVPVSGLATRGAGVVTTPLACGVPHAMEQTQKRMACRMRRLTAQQVDERRRQLIPSRARRRTEGNDLVRIQA